ncbi:hypothetical protein D3870_03155 [Noviherbaspirillum cavernae]|uniref:Nuclear transport factor 2 family protein n=1 Tax=Noviherbaspirillum cavernae TaxID=2320862 RepID=A0A418WY37_9BURK|nr:hypothetical protein [Noviherbaspirillum cavernae]RJG05148.1 hypothetical protein D3870_03155 [Noviherbaspirillum cavernae]
MDEFNMFAERYVAAWNETDAEARRAAIAALWTQDGAQLNKTLEAHGHQAIETRIVNSHNKWVRDAGYLFRSARNADGHHNTVKFSWEMVRPDDGTVVSVGVDFLLLDEEGRILADYQFIEPSRPART